jgi:hypothetical protein
MANGLRVRQAFLGHPANAHARQCKAPPCLSRRDQMMVARHGMPGTCVQKPVPYGMIGWRAGVIVPDGGQSVVPQITPFPTDGSCAPFTRHFMPGYRRFIPPGQRIVPLGCRRTGTGLWRPRRRDRVLPSQGLRRDRPARRCDDPVYLSLFRPFASC